MGISQQIAVDGGVGAISMLAGSNAADNHEKSRVVCLMNMVTADELLNDEEYDGKQPNPSPLPYLPYALLALCHNSPMQLLNMHTCRNQGRHPGGVLQIWHDLGG